MNIIKKLFNNPLTKRAYGRNGFFKAFGYELMFREYPLPEGRKEAVELRAVSSRGVSDSAIIPIPKDELPAFAANVQSFISLDQRLELLADTNQKLYAELLQQLETVHHEYFDEYRALNRWEEDEEEGLFDLITDLPRITYIDKYNNYEELDVMSLKGGVVRAFSREFDELRVISFKQHYFPLGELIQLYQQSR